MLYGIHSLRALENLGLTSPRQEKIPALKIELEEMKKNISEIETTLCNNFFEAKDQKKSETLKENFKSAKTRGISQKNSREKIKNYSASALRGNSKDPIKQPPFRLTQLSLKLIKLLKIDYIWLTGKEKPETRRKLPKYLLNIDSKIKYDVQKDRKETLTSQNKDRKPLDKNLRWEEWNAGNIQKKEEEFIGFKESEKSSSSFSDYNAADNVKEFYQKEFSKLLPNSFKVEKKKSHHDNNKKYTRGLANSSDSENWP